MCASSKGHSAVVEILIAKGADMNITAKVLLYIYTLFYSHSSYYVYDNRMDGQH